MYDEQVSSVRLSMIAPNGRKAKSTDRDARRPGVQVKCLGTREPIREVLRLARFGEVLDPVEGAPEAIMIVHLVGARWGASEEGKLAELLGAVRRAAEWFRQFSTGLLIIELSEVQYAGAGIPNAVALAKRLTRSAA
jgi:hypothetical protein